MLGTTDPLSKRRQITDLMFVAGAAVAAAIMGAMWMQSGQPTSPPQSVETREPAQPIVATPPAQVDATPDPGPPPPLPPPGRRPGRDMFLRTGPPPDLRMPEHPPAGAPPPPHACPPPPVQRPDMNPAGGMRARPIR